MFGLFHLDFKIIPFNNALLQLNLQLISPRVRIVMDMPCINSRLQFQIQFPLPFFDVNPDSLKLHLKRIFQRRSNKIKSIIKEEIRNHC